MLKFRLIVFLAAVLYAYPRVTRAILCGIEGELGSYEIYSRFVRVVPGKWFNWQLKPGSYVKTCRKEVLAVPIVQRNRFQ